MHPPEGRRILELRVARAWRVRPADQLDILNVFYTSAVGGAKVLYDDQGGLSDHYKTSISLSGSVATPSHWASSVIAHELGHWVVATYSRWPGEGGSHYVNQPSIPGLAWSEGAATFVSHSVRSDPLYFSKQKGTSFWVDLDALEASGSALPLPNPSGALDQPVCESVVTALVRDLDDPAPKGLGLAEAEVFGALASARMTGGLNRGYGKLDLVDDLDALTCGGVPAASLSTWVKDRFGFPYDGSAAICP